MSQQSQQNQLKKLPIGIEGFEKIRKGDYYYIDKTGLIIDLLNSGAEITLYTRPRRFGKSLNMSMLEAFFSPESDKSVFEGLRIAEETQLCREYMGQYPVIAVSLKSIDGADYDTAYRQAVKLINRAAAKVYAQVTGSGKDDGDAFAPGSSSQGIGDRLLPEEMENLTLLRQRNLKEADLYDSLRALSEILEKRTGRKVVIVIDEYDVPLARAHELGYYDQMVTLIRNLFHAALKTNPSLELAVLTGCMRISKESIFTGLNNLKVLGVADERADEYFGFTDSEVRRLLSYYEMPERYEEVRDWYDGYRFGRAEIYCPWDVLNYCDYARYNSEVYPENYWANSSGNTVVRRFIRQSGNATLRRELESLVNGETVEKAIRQDLTYQDMYASIDNIWSVLFTTGYLTCRGRNGSRLKLAIPNREVREIFTDQIMELFREETGKDGEALERLCDAMQEGDAPAAEACLNAYLRKTISVRDSAVRKSMKENFYHGILVGLLSTRQSWDVLSNQEAGDGYCDIQIRDVDRQMGIVIEAKYAEDGDLEAGCRRALSQIEEKRYAEKLVSEEYAPVLKYGIAFHLKKCRVMRAEDGR